jgi:hypothetical protein
MNFPNLMGSQHLWKATLYGVHATAQIMPKEQGNTEIELVVTWDMTKLAFYGIAMYLLSTDERTT